MDVDEIAEVISAGMCRGDKVAECSTCQRKLRAIEAVRAMGAERDAFVEAARVLVDLDDNGILFVDRCVCGECIHCDDQVTVDAARDAFDARKDSAEADR